MKMAKRVENFGLFVFIVFVFVANSGFAAVSGSIVGRVVDVKTGDPLPGANIVVEGSLFGASTDLDGNYVMT